MSKRIVLPGSAGEETAEARGGGGGDGGAALAGLLHWWRHRLSRGDAADPLQSAIGGVDDSGTATTYGATTATVEFPRPLAVPTGGVSLLVHAFGVPEQTGAGDAAVSVMGLCHFYRDPVAGWFAQHTTLGRAPSGVSASIGAALAGPPPGDTPVIQITGASGATIRWKVEVYRLERIRN